MKECLSFLMLLLVTQIAAGQVRNLTVKKDISTPQELIKTTKKLSPKSAIVPVPVSGQIETALNKIMDVYRDEPNTEATWVIIRKEVNDFMYSYFKNGKFTGTKPQEAYYVNIGLLSMTAQDLAQNKKILIVGFAEFRPAEFAVIKIERQDRTQ